MGVHVKRGATTIWELWNRILPPRDELAQSLLPGAVGEGSMNSRVSGPAGYQTFVRPQPAGDLTWVNCSLHSPYGDREQLEARGR